jgi:hypothetical protein
MRRIETLVGAALLAAAALLMPLAAFQPVQASHRGALLNVASACDAAVAGMCDRVRA